MTTLRKISQRTVNRILADENGPIGEVVETVHIPTVLNTIPDVTPVKINKPEMIVATFDVSLEAIATMKERAERFVITDHTDKVGFDAMSTFRKSVLKAQRLAVKKKFDELVDPHKDYTKGVKKIADELMNAIEAIERPLQIKEDAYTLENERIKEEQELAKRIRTDNRIKALQAAGFTYNVTTDAYEYMPDEPLLSQFVPNEDIVRLTDEAYQPTADIITQVIIEAKERQDEIDRQKQKDEDEKAQARQKELDDLEAERKQLAADRLEIKKAKDALDQQTIQNRGAVLISKGYEQTERGEYVYPGTAYGFVKSLLLELTDKQFGDDIIGIEQRVKQEKQAEANKKKDQAKADKKKRDDDKLRRARLDLPKKKIKHFLTAFGKFHDVNVPQTLEPETDELMHQLSVDFAFLKAKYFKEVDEL